MKDWDKQKPLILSFIQEHLQKVSEETIAKAFGISRSYFSRKFKELMGLSFEHYILTQRLKTAKDIFHQHPSLTIEEVSGLVGFKDMHYFSRQFKRLFSLSPTHFRHKVR